MSQGGALSGVSQGDGSLDSLRYDERECLLDSLRKSKWSRELRQCHVVKRIIQ